MAGVSKRPAGIRSSTSRRHQPHRTTELPRPRPLSPLRRRAGAEEIERRRMFIVPQTTTFPIVQDSGPQTTTVTVQMPGTITQAVAILTGFDVEFSHGDDHNLGRLDVELSVGGISNGTAVSVTVVYG